MRDGFTRRLDTQERDTSFEDFLSEWKPTVVVLSGESAGAEREIDTPSLSIGRGSDAGWTFADDTMSREHVVLEFADGGIRLRDLGSMNGTRLNGAEVRAAELKNGDRFQVGEHSFQLVLEKRPRQPKTYVVPEDA